MYRRQSNQNHNAVGFLHNKTYSDGLYPDNNPKKYKKKRVSADIGSSVVFDGRMLHQGLENNTDETRYAIYIVCYADSYRDEEATLGTVLDKNI